MDYPATQEWKRRNLAEAHIAIPPSVTYAPVDFEHQTLAEGLQLAGFDPTKATFFSWLGVTMYLTDEPQSIHVPVHRLDAAGRRSGVRLRRSDRVSQLDGTRWRCG